MPDEIDMLDEMISEGDRIEIWCEDGGIIISKNGENLAIEPGIRQAIQAAYQVDSN